MREQVALLFVVLIPFAAIVFALPYGRTVGITWEVAVASMAMYAICMLGITAGFHRLFAHRAYRASRGLKIGLAIAGSLAIQGPVFHWTADHRRHHTFSDVHGDPHSPWRYGTGFWALLRGMFHAHIGWLFEFEETSQVRFIPDLLKDRDLVVINRMFGTLAAVGVVLPCLLALGLGDSLIGALKVLLWVGLVRVFMVHHVTWSVNSVCHVFGQRPFRSRDYSGNVWPLAILSMGEAWHNGHHAMPYSARHGLLRGQIDVSALLIRGFERAGWASGVRWPSPADVLAARRLNAIGDVSGSG
jgi:stearoyl-CoA desaturase (Delta-9 desaturase)